MDVNDLFEYIEHRNKYKEEFDVVSKDDHHLPFSDIMVFVVACGLSPSTDDLLPMLERIGHQEFPDLPKAMAVEMMFYPRLPTALDHQKLNLLASITTKNSIQ